METYQGDRWCRNGVHGRVGTEVGLVKKGDVYLLPVIPYLGVRLLTVVLVHQTRNRKSWEWFKREWDVETQPNDMQRNRAPNGLVLSTQYSCIVSCSLNEIQRSSSDSKSGSLRQVHQLAPMDGMPWRIALPPMESKGG